MNFPTSDHLLYKKNLYFLHSLKTDFDENIYQNSHNCSVFKLVHSEQDMKQRCNKRTIILGCFFAVSSDVKGSIFHVGHVKYVHKKCSN